ncbi:histidine kinase protein [Rutstroemia sp. NJR-2017a BVV2]|nr:histidine kinase protein [Rutstroemia sp. NJR-2017a BVV2]
MSYLPDFAAPHVLQHKTTGGPQKTANTIPQKAYSSSDRALNAFAQLGALRLRAKRAMISLIDSKHQYTLAESTQTLSSQSDDVYEAGDSLWMGVKTIPREESLCAAKIWRPTPRQELNDNDEIPRPEPIVVNDLAEDPILKENVKIDSGPKARFYATIPIRTRRGFDIGSYCVMDEEPRDGLKPGEIEFLKDMADTVMEHFEYMSVRKDHQRGERMVKGLGLFVEGQSTLSAWWLRTRTDRETSIRSSRRTYSTRSAGGTDEPLLEHYSSMTSTEGDSTEDGSLIGGGMGSRHSKSQGTTESLSHNLPDPSSLKEFQNAISFSPEVISPVTSAAPGSTTASAAAPKSNKRPVLTAASTITPNTVGAFHALKATKAHKEDERNVSDTAEALKMMLSRASNLIREAADVDGVAFFHTKPSGFGSLGHNSSMVDASSTGKAVMPSSSEDDTRSSLSTSDSTTSKSAHTSRKERVCEVMAYSTSSESSIRGSHTLPDHLSVRQDFVHKLLKRHPHGKIYAFDEDGSISSSEDELNDAIVNGEVSVVADGPKTPRRTSSRVLEGETILKIFPGARFVMVLPLWDSRHEQWFSSIMLWTTNPTRVLTLEDDLTYVAAFGNSIMAEASRLDIIAADNTKSTLIGSISHELRSPLHGILGSIEILQDTVMSRYQSGLVNTIGHCSSTLLDTLSNVLDYAKINNFTAAQKAEQKVIRASHRMRKPVPAENFRVYGTISLTTDVNLASITEDVIGGVYAGYEYVEKTTAATLMSELDYPTSPTVSSNPHISTTSLNVLLDIDHKSDWNFSTQPGAWKRILMNVFGNALKYTSSGLVKVALSSRKSSNNQSFVTLTITDTGKGIAADFLERQVYTPFSQEDSLSPGAGLGLSIVRQIISGLDGKIHISSVQGMGTVVKVVLKLDKSHAQAPEESRLKPKDVVQRAKAYTNGLRMVWLGGDVSAPVPDHEHVETPGNPTSLGFTICRMARNWFGMNTRQAVGLDDGGGDVFFVSAETFDQLVHDWKKFNLAQKDLGKRHIIVVTGTSQAGTRTMSEILYNIHFIGNPIGPKKLAQCFISIFEQSGKPIVIRTRSTSKLQEHEMSRPSGSTNRRPPSSIKFPESVPTSPTTESPPIIQPAILLVEDNPVNMKILVTCMRRMQVPFYTAENGQQAYERYKSESRKPDIIFMDVSMPVMDGFQASRHIRAYEREESLPAAVIIAVTGLASEESQREAYNSGINLFMSKPVPLKDMRRIVEEWREERSRRE